MAKSKRSGGSGDSGKSSYEAWKRTAIRGALRQAWKLAPQLKEIYKLNRIELTVQGRFRVYYQCAICLKQFCQKDTQVDHIDPVGPTPVSRNAPAGLTWGEFIDRMFCDISNLRIVCKPCHQGITKESRRGKAT